jgi:hypothetical protein
MNYNYNSKLSFNQITINLCAGAPYYETNQSILELAYCCYDTAAQRIVVGFSKEIFEFHSCCQKTINIKMICI